MRPDPAAPWSIALAALAALAAPALAQYPDRSGWEPTVRFFVSSADASGEDAGSASSRFELSSGTAFGVSYEFRPRRRFGIEVGLGVIELDMTASVDFTSVGGDLQRRGGSLTFIPLTAAFNLHLLRPGKADLYLGAVAGFVNGSSESFAFTSLSGFPFSLEVEGGDDAVFGGQVGLDFTFGDSGWGLGLRVRSLGDLSLAEATTNRFVDVEISEPVLLASVAVVRRF